MNLDSVRTPRFATVHGHVYSANLFGTVVEGKELVPHVPRARSSRVGKYPFVSQDDNEEEIKFLYREVSQTLTVPLEMWESFVRRHFEPTHTGPRQSASRLLWANLRLAHSRAEQSTALVPSVNARRPGVRILQLLTVDHV